MYGRFAEEITPEEFELFVKRNLESYGDKLVGFKAQHREVLQGSDGDYEIDITARFEALGADFLVLVECKRYSNRIKREVVELLYSRIRSTGAHKGMLFATSEFQSGAIKFASKHGIALVSVVDGKSTYQTKALGPKPEPPPWANLPKYAGWLVRLSDSGGVSFSSISSRDPSCLLKEMRRIEDKC